MSRGSRSDREIREMGSREGERENISSFLAFSLFSLT
jgi:hypothetical protein